MSVKCMQWDFVYQQSQSVKLCRSWNQSHTQAVSCIDRSSEKQAHKQQGMQKVYFEINSPGTKISLTSEPGPITQDIFHIYNYMPFSTLPAITAATLREPKEKKIPFISFRWIIC